MDFKQIQDLIKLMGKSDLSELKVEQDNFKITLKKGTGAQPVYVSTAPALPQVTSPQIVEKTESEPPKVVTESAATEEKYITVKSPMIGTFYRSSSPEKAPFIKVGDVINKGDHICIIEAMKLFNEIEAEVAGKVVKVLADDASPIEYDQPMFLIDPSGV